VEIVFSPSILTHSREASAEAVVMMVLLAPTILLMFIAERVLKQEYLAAGFGKV
jgi:hypothetical protein